LATANTGWDPYGRTGRQAQFPNGIISNFWSGLNLAPFSLASAMKWPQPEAAFFEERVESMDISETIGPIRHTINETFMAFKQIAFDIPMNNGLLNCGTSRHCTEARTHSEIESGITALVATYKDLLKREGKILAYLSMGNEGIVHKSKVLSQLFFGSMSKAKNSTSLINASKVLALLKLSPEGKPNQFRKSIVDVDETILVQAENSFKALCGFSSID
jgi:hypothetical protein